TADHGDQAGYQGLYDKDLGCHSREIMSVPFIIRPAPCLNASPAGRQCQEPVELVDLFPTLCALNGLETPAAVEGRNLEPALVRGEALDPSRPVFCEKYRVKSVTRNNWQLSFAWEIPEECLLINYADDPWATRNLYMDDTWIEKRIELKKELFMFLMRRLHGPYTPSDADYFLDKLNGRNGRLPLLCPPVEGVSSYRSAGAIRQGNIVMYVPYFEPDFHLFTCKGKSYHTLADALPRDPVRVDSILDDGLNDCFLKVHPIAVIPSGFGAL
ncbi:MAG: hypothetical protein HY343_07485, partial [Lentisphaerae bacterium]|nr:hypothetical protein [Lentisphaerota bacterium]